jgi:TRAP-type C4-dicarboxylate transport system permease large subunit
VKLIGGVFIILGVAMGLTNYLVDAEVPAKAALWVQGHVESRIVFLLALNVFLLIVGCLMDIFSAIVVVVPLILPISQVFNMDPLHLAVIFLANLELGYVTPPVGMNLFLATYRFDKPLVQVYRSAVPFLLVLIAVVLLITYVPSLTLGVR